jgi:hypothetical protein
VETLLYYLQRKAFGRARRGGQVEWWVIVASIWMLRRARHRAHVVLRTELKPGERLVISTREPKSTASVDL